MMSHSVLAEMNNDSPRVMSSHIRSSREPSSSARPQARQGGRRLAPWGKADSAVTMTSKYLGGSRANRVISMSRSSGSPESGMGAGRVGRAAPTLRDCTGAIDRTSGPSCSKNGRKRSEITTDPSEGQKEIRRRCARDVEERRLELVTWKELW